MSDLVQLVYEMKPTLMGVGVGTLTAGALHAGTSLARGFKAGTTVTDEFKKTTGLQTTLTLGSGAIAGLLASGSNYAYNLEMIPTGIRALGAAVLIGAVTGVGRSLYKAATTTNDVVSSFRDNCLSTYTTKGAAIGAAAYVVLDHISRM